MRNIGSVVGFFQQPYSVLIKGGAFNFLQFLYTSKFFPPYNRRQLKDIDIFALLLLLLIATLIAFFVLHFLQNIFLIRDCHHKRHEFASSSLSNHSRNFINCCHRNFSDRTINFNWNCVNNQNARVRLQ